MPQCTHFLVKCACSSIPSLRVIFASLRSDTWHLTVIQMHISFFFSFIYLFIYLPHSWLCWVFVPTRGPSPAVASRDHPSSRCAGLSPSQPLLLRSTGSRRAGSAIMAHGPSRSVACGILPDQGLNPCPLHWQADPQPLRHQGSPPHFFYVYEYFHALRHLFRSNHLPTFLLIY